MTQVLVDNSKTKDEKEGNFLRVGVVYIVNRRIGKGVYKFIRLSKMNLKSQYK